jgi:hypothetical protein
MTSQEAGYFLMGLGFGGLIVNGVWAFFRMLLRREIDGHR